MAAGRFAEARAHLNDVTNAAFAGVKHRLEHNLAERENAATNPGRHGVSTNAPAVPANAPNPDAIKLFHGLPRNFCYLAGHNLHQP